MNTSKHFDKYDSENINKRKQTFADILAKEIKKQKQKNKR